MARRDWLECLEFEPEAGRSLGGPHRLSAEACSAGEHAYMRKLRSLR